MSVVVQLTHITQILPTLKQMAEGVCFDLTGEDGSVVGVIISPTVCEQLAILLPAYAKASSWWGTNLRGASSQPVKK